MVSIKDIIAIIFMVTLVAGMVFFVKRIDEIRKTGDNVYIGFYIISAVVLFIIFCIATVCLLSHL